MVWFGHGIYSFVRAKNAWRSLLSPVARNHASSADAWPFVRRSSFRYMGSPCESFTMLDGRLLLTAWFTNGFSLLSVAAAMYPLAGAFLSQLSPNGSLHRSALQCRKALGLRLARLDPSVTRRKRRAAWGCWLEETKRSLEEQRLVRTNRGGSGGGGCDGSGGVLVGFWECWRRSCGGDRGRTLFSPSVVADAVYAVSVFLFLRQCAQCSTASHVHRKRKLHLLMPHRRGVRTQTNVGIDETDVSTEGPLTLMEVVDA